MKTPLASFCLCTVLLAASTCVFSASPKEYNALIKKAQAGDYQPALAMLRERNQTAPDDLRALYDHIIVAGWAGNTDEVLEVYRSLKPTRKSLPAEVQSAVARAYRDTKQWDQALALYRDGARRFPKQSSFSIGETMVLAEAGKTQEALALGQSLVEKSPKDPDQRLALGYVYRINAQPYAALKEIAKAHTLAPNKPYVTREYILALQHAGIAEAALRTAQDNPGIMDEAEMRHLEADHAAELTRIAAMPSRLEAERFVIADKALGEYDRLMAEWRALGEPAKDQLLRIRIDRLQALHARARMRDVVKEYEQLRAEGVEVPRYVLNDVASAYLVTRRPNKARELYEKVLADEAAQRDDEVERLSYETGLFYSLIETENFGRADRVIKQAQARQPAWRRIRGVPDSVPNDLHLHAEQTAALNYFYTDDTPTAQRQLETYVAQAPRNVGLRVGLAHVYRARAQPRLAEKELKMAETLAPTSRDIISGQASTAMALKEWRQAEMLNNNLMTRYPENATTQLVARDWNTYKKAELRVSAFRGLSDNSPVSGSGDFGIDTVLYSAPLDYNWRVFGGVGYAQGDFEEGRGHYRYARTGVEWRGRDLTAEFEASGQNFGHGNKPGLSATAAYDISDYWQVGASADWRSRETPLRALANNISSNSLGAFVRWRANDQREWTFSFSPSRFSDGNKRYALLLRGKERIYTSPKLKLDLELNASGSRNTRQNVPYFNPRADLEIVPALSLTHLVYRRYETAFQQKFTVGAGTYSQRGYGTTAIGTLGYAVRYEFNQLLDFGLSATGINRTYDGQRERELRILFDMSLRF